MKITTNPEEFTRQLSDAHLILLPAHPPQYRQQKPQSFPARWPGLMSTTTLAEYLDMSVNSVLKLVRQGVLPGPELSPSPRLKRWSREAVEKRIQKHCDGNRGEPSMDDLLRQSRSVAGGH